MNMKRITLTNGYESIIDDEDYQKVSQFKWYAKVKTNTIYGERRNGTKRQRLHHIIMGTTQTIDHIDGDGLNNQKSNLRVCTTQQNNYNTKKAKRKNVTSDFKGVSINIKSGRWKASLGFNKQNIYLGTFDTQLEAAEAYNKAAIKYFGEFAKINVFKE